MKIISKNVRPPITVIIVCLFELLGLVLLPFSFFDEQALGYGLLYQFYLAFCGVIGISIIWFLWKMRRTGIYIYVASYAFHNIVALIVGNWHISVLIIPVVGLLLLLPHLKKMT